MAITVPAGYRDGAVWGSNPKADGNTRLYTDDDLDRLEVILHLTRDLGVNLPGVEIILNMR
jgi:DNA-binding transcriptional MerR regulator